MTIDQPNSHAFWRLKRLRQLKGVTLEELATKTGLTKSYLSKVERGISVPSIAAALKLADAFGVGVGELFGVNAQVEDYAVVRKNQRKPFSRDGDRAGYYYEAIAPGLTPGQFEAFVMHPPRKEAPGLAGFEHNGQEMIFVLKGGIEVFFPHASVKLSGGDSIVFTGRLPHRILSVGAQRAETLVIITNENELHHEGKEPRGYRRRKAAVKR
jgi:transcriptional regulator with XRE-family HTH domain